MKITTKAKSNIRTSSNKKKNRTNRDSKKRLSKTVMRRMRDKTMTKGKLTKGQISIFKALPR